MRSDADSTLRQRYEELLTAIDDRGFADKRTEEQAHADALATLERRRKQFHSVYRQCVRHRAAAGLSIYVKDVIDDTDRKSG